VWFIRRCNANGSSAKGHEFFLRHYLGTHDNAVAPEIAEGHTSEVVYRPEAPSGKLDLVVDLNFRMDTSALYSDIVLPAATWYEKDDLNTTDLHSYINPMQAAIAPAWESRSDWEIYKAIARKVTDLADAAMPVRGIVMLRCSTMRPTSWRSPVRTGSGRGGCDPRRTMPKFRSHATMRIYTTLVCLAASGRRRMANGSSRRRRVQEADRTAMMPSMASAVTRRGPGGGRGHLARSGLQR
jgi:nitrate reductase alpha subunit